MNGDKMPVSPSLSLEGLSEWRQDAWRIILTQLLDSGQGPGYVCKGICILMDFMGFLNPNCIIIFFLALKLRFAFNGDGL